MVFFLGSCKVGHHRNWYTGCSCCGSQLGLSNLLQMHKYKLARVSQTIRQLRKYTLIQIHKCKYSKLAGRLSGCKSRRLVLCLLYQLHNYTNTQIHKYKNTHLQADYQVASPDDWCCATQLGSAENDDPLTVPLVSGKYTITQTHKYINTNKIHKYKYSKLASCKSRRLVLCDIAGIRRQLNGLHLNSADRLHRTYHPCQKKIVKKLHLC